MQPKQLQDLAIEALNDLKAVDLTAFDVSKLTTITDFMIICSGRSNRHVKSLAENVITTAKKHQIKHISVEGEREGEWVIVDLGDVVVHVMLPTTRSFYQLEDLWEPVQQHREKHR
jgi:ribosome-associated protein